MIVWILATIVRGIVRAALRAARLDERFGGSVGSTPGNVSPSQTLGEVAFYLIWLLFLPGILAAFGLDAVLVPFQTMINEILAYVPKSQQLAIILLIGIFVFRLVRQIVAGSCRLLGWTGLGHVLV